MKIPGRYKQPAGRNDIAGFERRSIIQSKRGGNADEEKTDIKDNILSFVTSADHLDSHVECDYRHRFIWGIPLEADERETGIDV